MDTQIILYTLSGALVITGAWMMWRKWRAQRRFDEAGRKKDRKQQRRTKDQALQAQQVISDAQTHEKIDETLRRFDEHRQ